MFDDEVSSEPLVDGPADGGQAEVEGQAPEPTYLPVDDYRDSYVKVKVDGEEMDVPLAEALNGYQRTADYTRKTQELAEQRRQLEYAQTLQRALEANPAQTLSLLQQTYGVGTQQQTAEVDDDEDWFQDPLEQRIRSFEERFQQWEVSQAQQQLERELQGLQQKYGEDFNPPEVIQAALMAGTSDLETVYKQIAFDRLFARMQGQQQFQSKQAEEDQRRVAAKEAAAVVHSGSGAASASAASASPTSLAEAWFAAKQQLGVS